MENECSASSEAKMKTVCEGGRQPGGNKLNFALLCSGTCVLVAIASTAAVRFLCVHCNIFLFL